MASLTALTGRPLTTFLAGLALKMVSSLVNGLMPLALLRRRLLHHDQADQTWNDEQAVLLQLGVADGGHGLDNPLHILAGELFIELVGNLLDES